MKKQFSIIPFCCFHPDFFYEFATDSGLNEIPFAEKYISHEHTLCPFRLICTIFFCWLYLFVCFIFFWFCFSKKTPSTKKILFQTVQIHIHIHKNTLSIYLSHTKKIHRVVALICFSLFLL